MTWKYQPDEDPKRKHGWDLDKPGFLEVRGVKIGKCPSGLTLEKAEELLNDGIPFHPARDNNAWPKRIYVVHEGVVYRATPTVPGTSYHGFPEFPEELRQLPSTLRAAILKKARDLGCEEDVRRWINT